MVDLVLLCSLCTQRERKRRDNSEMRFLVLLTLDSYCKNSTSYILIELLGTKIPVLPARYACFGRKYDCLGGWELFPYLQPRKVFECLLLQLLTLACVQRPRLVNTPSLALHLWSL